MSRLMLDGTAEPVSRDQILRHARGQGNIHFPCSADHEQDWQPYPVDPYSAICDDHTYINTYILIPILRLNLMLTYAVLSSSENMFQYYTQRTKTLLCALLHVSVLKTFMKTAFSSKSCPP